MTTKETLATYRIPHRHPRAAQVTESLDCGIAVLEDSFAEALKAEQQSLNEGIERIWAEFQAAAKGGR